MSQLTRVSDERRVTPLEDEKKEERRVTQLEDEKKEER
jgi:hypothetical protein